MIENETLINRYITYRRNTGRRPWRENTVSLRQGTLRIIGQRLPVPLVLMTEDHVQEYRSRILRSSYKPETVRAHISALRGLSRWMVHPGRLRTDDPCIGLDYIDVPESAVPALSSREYDLALACALSRPEMYLWLGLMGCLGLRCCEVAWMMTYDVEVRDDGGSLLHIVGKGGKRRTVPAGRYLTASLRPFLTVHGPVFTRPSDGDAYRPQGVGWHVKKFLTGVGISASAHQLRRRFAEDYHELDPDLYRQAKIMGHTSISTTQGYIRITPLMAAGYIEKIVQRRLGRGRTRAS